MQYNILILICLPAVLVNEYCEGMKSVKRPTALGARMRTQQEPKLTPEELEPPTFQGKAKMSLQKQDANLDTGGYLFKHYIFNRNIYNNQEKPVYSDAAVNSPNYENSNRTHTRPTNYNKNDHANNNNNDQKTIEDDVNDNNEEFYKDSETPTASNEMKYNVINNYGNRHKNNEYRENHHENNNNNNHKTNFITKKKNDNKYETYDVSYRANDKQKALSDKNLRSNGNRPEMNDNYYISSYNNYKPSDNVNRTNHLHYKLVNDSHNPEYRSSDTKVVRLDAIIDNNNNKEDKISAANTTKPDNKDKVVPLTVLESLVSSMKQSSRLESIESIVKDIQHRLDDIQRPKLSTQMPLTTKTIIQMKSVTVQSVDKPIQVFLRANDDDEPEQTIKPKNDVVKEMDKIMLSFLRSNLSSSSSESNEQERRRRPSIVRANTNVKVTDDIDRFDQIFDQDLNYELEGDLKFKL